MDGSFLRSFAIVLLSFIFTIPAVSVVCLDFLSFSNSALIAPQSQVLNHSFLRALKDQGVHHLIAHLEVSDFISMMEAARENPGIEFHTGYKEKVDWNKARQGDVLEPYVKSGRTLNLLALHEQSIGKIASLIISPDRTIMSQGTLYTQPESMKVILVFSVDILLGQEFTISRIFTKITQGWEFERGGFATHLPHHGLARLNEVLSSEIEKASSGENVARGSEHYYMVSRPLGLQDVSFFWIPLPLLNSLGEGRQLAGPREIDGSVHEFSYDGNSGTSRIPLSRFVGGDWKSIPLSPSSPSHSRQFFISEGKLVTEFERVPDFRLLE